MKRSHGAPSSRRQKDRGVAAFRRAAAGTKWGEFPPLLEHAVKDSTLGTYAKALRQFLDWARKEGRTARTVDRLDFLMADYFSVLCFCTLLESSRAALTFAAVKHFLPEVGRGFPAAARALKAYQKIYVGREGEGFGEEVFGLILDALQARSKEAALVFALSVDCYLRGAEWSDLRPEDVSVPPSGPVALSLGVAERGDSTKTGPEQGVVASRPWVVNWVRAFAKRRSGDSRRDRFFAISRAQYEDHFSAVVQELRLGKFGLRITPHSARHAGATIDALIHDKGLRYIQDRGRWAAPASVKRYAKPYLIVRQNARLPVEWLDKGSKCLCYWQKWAERQ